MVHRDLKIYFGGFDVVGVRWLDDSSCNVQFKDEFTAKNALFKRITEAAQGEAREAGLDVFGLNWLEALPYKKTRSDTFGSAGSMTRMWIRLATVQDVTHKGMDRPLVQSSTLAGQAAAAGGTFGALVAGAGQNGAGTGVAATGAAGLAAAGQAAWNQLMSTHNQNKRNRRKKKKRRRAKGAAGSAAMRMADDNAARDAEFEKYASAAKEARAASK